MTLATIIQVLEWFWAVISDPFNGIGYQVFSGLLGATAIFSGVYVWSRHKNCHEHHCWRIGHVLLPDGTLTCHRHDPRHNDKKPQPGHVKRMWNARERWD